ncbi:MAG: Uncharacterised protein [Flavobacterium sp. SCGC AAA160-P02]|nr:MAG: Uncharacterised protein [Flavobacterium sp. SCGC AAA160-P02]|tara:strand:+ start:52 stop:783 length:732 start_codon:yes stop_codon:yes gene_type:complete
MKKIKITLILFLFSISIVYSQNSSTGVSDNNTSNLLRITGDGGNSSGQTYGTAMRFVNPPRTVDGSIYLYEKWNNNPTVVTSKDNKTFTLNNINFNLRTNRMVTRISKDSIFIIDMNKIDNINILDKTFKKIDTEIGSRVFEVIFESDDLSVLNFHSVKFVEGSVNPMLSRKTDKLIQKETFYLLRGGEIKEFRLRKKDIQDLIPVNVSEKNMLIKYYKNGKYSHKRINDLKLVLSKLYNTTE